MLEGHNNSYVVVCGIFGNLCEKNITEFMCEKVTSRTEPSGIFSPPKSIYHRGGLSRSPAGMPP